MSRNAQGRKFKQTSHNATTLISLGGQKAYVPMDKIKLRQEERKVKNLYQEEKKKLNKEAASKAHTDAIIAEKSKKKRKRGNSVSKEPPAKRARPEPSEEEETGKSEDKQKYKQKEKPQPVERKQRERPQRGETKQTQLSKADPFYKAKLKHEQELIRQEAIRKEKEERAAWLASQAKQRQQRGKKMRQRNAKGQPLMKNLLANLMPKVEQTSK